MPAKIKKIFILFIAVSIGLSLNAQQLKVASIFGDNMILQQQTETPVWGKDKPGTRLALTTSWNKQTYSLTADNNGNWTVRIKTPVAGGPYSIFIQGSEKITINNIWIGEVWLASGQSNMSMPLKGYQHQPVQGSTEAILNAKNKKIHFINVPEMAAYKPLDDFDAQWRVASPETAGECSAVCWFFAVMLNNQLDVPIGIINASYSGSNVEAWMTPEACKRFNDIEVPPLSDETSPWISNVPTVLYNGMIHPLVGYGIKGFIWYQGESNVFNVPRYAPSVAAMVNEWRKEWKCGEFPFYFAQIAPYDYKEWDFFTPQWPEISAYQREAQLKSQSMIANSAMAVLMDIGEEKQIHPPHKREVGERLALLALSKTYGMSGFESESPEYERMEIEGNKAIIYFSKQFMGLTSYGKPLQLFEIAGEDKVFYQAQAHIDGDKGTVVVTSPLVKEPKSVRYAFKDFVTGELFGTGGLPVSSFRTDDWGNETNNYYFDSQTGDDSNTGISPDMPLRSLSKIKDLAIKPGDSILLKSGAVFTEKLFFTAKGSPDKPVVLGKYGGETRPHIKGDATELEMVHVFNSEYVVVRDLEISNKGERIRPYLSGLLVELHNYGKANDITVDNLFIHDVYGSLIKGEGHEHPDAGGGQAMLFRNYRNDDTDTIPSYFNGLLVQNCLIKDSQRNGIMMWGNWARNNWYPNTQVVIRNNVLDGVPGDGIVPTACDGAIVEYNVMKNCPPTLPSSEACDGIWPFSSDNTIIQYNIVSDHKSKIDGYGFDSDYNCRNSLFQYNLSYNNEGGFLLLCNSGGWPEDWSAGNQGTIVKYNVSINDGIRNFIVEDEKDDYFSPVIHITGPAKNSYIEKNIFYVCKKELPRMDKRLVCSDDWRGYADSTFFRYNSIFVEEPALAFDPTLSTNNFFKENVYVGPLQTPDNGFIKQERKFDKSVWYDEHDKNWNLLIHFLKDKTLLFEGKETPVLEVIGFY